MDHFTYFEDLSSSGEISNKCPLCYKIFEPSQLEKHASNCIPENNTNSIDFVYFEQEEILKKKQEEEKNDRLLMELLEEEKRNSLKKQEEPPMFCDLCEKFVDLSRLYFLENCVHSYCKICIIKFIDLKIAQMKCSEICCQMAECKKSLKVSEIKGLLSKECFERYEKACLIELVNNGTYIQCPNERCNIIIEKLRGKSSFLDHSVQEMGPNGIPLSKEAIIHRDENRFRCRECQTDFCSACRSVPYHLSFTCDQFSLYQNAKHCRFCNSQLRRDNTAVNKEHHKGLEDICNAKECMEKKEISCTKIRSCGHNCFGIINEMKCPPCLHEDCAKKSEISQNSKDYCNICWVEDLGSSPSIRLDCGHYFHYSCVKKKILNKWSGSRITFGFLECALCKQRMSHTAIEKEIEPILKLFEEVKEKATQRLNMLNLGKCEEVTKKESKFYNNPSGYAMYRFSYFPCFKCKKCYFGGEKVCDGNNDVEFDPKELVCGSCSDFAALEDCPKHGKDFVEYKCKFCCNVSVWFCWGTTHFCDDCHKKASSITSVPKNNLPACTCSIKHPPNGDEFLLGCSLCRIQKFNCF
jgi:hypothetical protein